MKGLTIWFVFLVKRKGRAMDYDCGRKTARKACGKTFSAETRRGERRPKRPLGAKAQRLLAPARSMGRLKSGNAPLCGGALIKPSGAI